MPFGLVATAIVLVALLWQLAAPQLRRLAVPRLARAAASLRSRLRHGVPQAIVYDPGRELRAEQRARTLLCSCVNKEEWEMYRDLGFLRVWGGSVASRRLEATEVADERPGAQALRPGRSLATIAAKVSGAEAAPVEADYAYLIYPHWPIVAYLPKTGVLLNEYCVSFKDQAAPEGATRLPDADDVLAKWMAITADEHVLISGANMHLPGRQIDPDRVRRDLVRLARWERERLGVI